MQEKVGQVGSGETPPVAWGLLLILSILWGGSFLFIEVAVEEIPPLTLAFGRVTMAAAALWLTVAVLRLDVPMTRQLFGIFLVMGLFNNAIPFALISWGQVHISAGLAAILNATTPIFAVLIAHCLTADDRLTWRKSAGVVIGLCGVAVIVGAGAVTELSLQNLGQFLVIMGSVSYGIAAMINRQVRKMPPLVASAGMLTSASFWLLPAAALIDWPLASRPGFEAVAALVALAFLSTALAYLLFFRVVALSGTTNATLVTLIIPVSAVGLSIVFLGEGVAPHHLVGMLIILLGLSVIDGRLFRALRAILGTRRGNGLIR